MENDNKRVDPKELCSGEFGDTKTTQTQPSTDGIAIDRLTGERYGSDTNQSVYRRDGDAIIDTRTGNTIAYRDDSDAAMLDENY